MSVLDGTYSRERLRSELIQVAAVAVAIVEDLDYGAADSNRPLSHPNDERQGKKTITSPVLAQVFKERQDQDGKWGPQHHDPVIWLLILMEEVGEAADEVDVPTDPALVADLASADHIGHIGLLGERAKKWLEGWFG